jgi:hypothetical protein
VGDRVDDRLAPDAVAAGDLRREAGERHERIHELRMLLAPQPGVHAAHGGAHDEPRMVHLQPLGEQQVLRLHHVVVGVVREVSVQAIARLARLAMPDAVGQHDEITCGIERLTGTEQLPGEFIAHQAPTVAAGAMHDEHRVTHHAMGVRARLA